MTSGPPTADAPRAAASRERAASMRHLLGPTVTVTACTVSAQAVTFGIQIWIAATFGAGTTMDAFYAASTLPQYFIAVVLGALGVVFVPLLVQRTRDDQEAATALVNAVVSWTAVVVGLAVVAGIVFAGPVLQWTTPGLAQSTLTVAITVARVSWPAVVFTALATVATGVYHARRRFAWPSIVPLLGTIVNILLAVVLARPLGVTGLAVAGTVAACLQAALLLPPVFRQQGGFRLRFGPRHSMQRVFHLLWPLLFTGALYRASTIVDRYWASSLGPGAISHLGYAFKLVASLQLLLATGIATVTFPRMAESSAAQDLAALRRTVDVGMRVMWLCIAPVILVGQVLATPLIVTVFRRGAFLEADAAVVATLLQIYLLSLAGACMGTLSGRAFYALGRTRTIAVLGTIDALGYVMYTPLLARHWGASGIAIAYVIYFTFGLATQLALLGFALRAAGAWRSCAPLARVGVSAALAAGCAFLAARWAETPTWKLAAGGAAGALAYVAFVRMLAHEEFAWVRHAAARATGRPAVAPEAAG